MKEIKLSRGLVALVDDEDFDMLNQHKWYASSAKSAPTFYAIRRIGKNKVSMHREILGLTDTKLCGDHIDHNGLNNQRANLRIVTHAENLANRSKRKGTSRFLGVYLSNKNNSWVATITKGKRLRYLGSFFIEEDAARAYNIAAKELHGEFANLNDVDMSLLPVKNKQGWHKTKFRSN